MAADQHVLRLRIADDPKAFVVINVSKGGSKELDLRLVGTEGETPYMANLQARNIAKLHTSHWTGTPDEWKLVLSHILLQVPIDDKSRLPLKDVEAIALVRSGRSLEVVIRKNTGGMTQRLGSIELTANEDEEISFFDWTGAAAAAASLAQDEITVLKSKFADQQATVTKLQTQLEDLIKAKQEHENSMIEKFRLLLNNKKQKIRDQQRLLSNAKVDQAVAEEVQESRATTSRARKPAASRKGKRKAKDPSPERAAESADQDSDDPQTRDDREFAHQETPDPSEDEKATEDEAEDDDEEAESPPSRVKPEPKSQSQRLSTRSQDAKSQTQRASTRSQDAKSSKQSKASVEPDELPPPRQLPFGRGGKVSKQPGNTTAAASATASSSHTVAANDDDDDTDDEL